MRQNGFKALKKTCSRAEKGRHEDGGVNVERRVPPPVREIQGGPSASGKRYVDSKFEVAFSCKFIL